MKQYLNEIERALEQFPKRTSVQNPESYIGGGQSKLKFLGLRVPHLHETLKNGFSFLNSEPKQIVKVWDYVWMNSECYEVLSLPLAWFYQHEQRSTLKDHWPTLKSWSGKIDNWAHSDTLSGIYARLLEDNPKLVYPTLVQWNKSKNPWLRRLSLVSLIYYSSHREKVLGIDKILPLIENQLDHKHYYVQKGVGWTLREAHTVYPNLFFNLLKKTYIK